MAEITTEELKTIIKEVIAEQKHTCILTDVDIAAIKTVSGFLTRCRNALGNFMMVVLAVVALMGIGGFLYLVSGGHINLFKVFGIGV
jgi:predicted Ser/Thr protein kinase